MLQGTMLRFLQNNATTAREAIFGGLFDRCTVNQLNPKHKQGLTQGHLYLKALATPITLIYWHFIL